MLVDEKFCRDGIFGYCFGGWFKKCVNYMFYREVYRRSCYDVQIGFFKRVVNGFDLLY